MLGLSRCSTYVLPSELIVDVASRERASVRAFFAQVMWQVSKNLNFKMRVCALCKYLAIAGSRASNFSLVCSTTSWESVNVLNFLIPSSLIIFNPARSVSYSVWLFDSLKEKRSTYLATTLYRFVRIKPTPLSSELDALSTWSIHVFETFIFALVLVDFFIEPWAFCNEVG